MFQLHVHIVLDHVHGHVTGALDHHLHIVLPGDLGQLAEGLQFAELGLVVGVRQAAGAQPVTQGEADVVGLHDLADVLEMGVEETLPVVGDTPLGHDGAAAGDDAGNPLGGQWHVTQQHPGVDGEVVHTLFRLFDEGVAKHLPGEVLGDAVDLFQGLVDGHGADGHWRVAQDVIAGGVDVLAGGQVHHRVATPAGGPHQLLHFLFDIRGEGRVADVGVDLHQEVAADNHRLQLRVVDIGGNDGPALGHFFSDEFWGNGLQVGAHSVAGEAFVAFLGGEFVVQCFPGLVFAQGDIFHLRRDDSLPRVVYLGDVASGFGAAGLTLQRFVIEFESFVLFLVAVVDGRDLAAFIELGIAAGLDPGAAQVRQTLVDVDIHVRISVGAGGVVDCHRSAIGEADFPNGYPHVGVALRAQINLTAGGQRFTGNEVPGGRLHRCF